MLAEAWRETTSDLSRTEGPGSILGKKRKLTDYLMGGIWRRFERSFKELLGECGKT